MPLQKGRGRLCNSTLCGFSMGNHGSPVLGGMEKAAADLTWPWQQLCVVDKRLPGPFANTSAMLSCLHHVFLGQRAQIHSFCLSAASTSQISSASLGCRATTTSLQRPNPNPKGTKKKRNRTFLLIAFCSTMASVIEGEITSRAHLRTENSRIN